MTNEFLANPANTIQFQKRILGFTTPFGILIRYGKVRAGVSHSKLMLYFLGMALLALMFSELVAIMRTGTVTPFIATDNLIAMGLMAVLVRLTPLSGIHAAEHQVILALSQGLPLTLETVRQQSRVDPRCGSSTVILLLMASPGLILAWNGMMTMNNLSLGLGSLGLLLTLWLGPRISQWVQGLLLTKEPTDQQLKDAIGVAEELRAKMELS
jgi:uncharacterized protein YqhQ